jgi:hypothetical protein
MPLPNAAPGEGPVRAYTHFRYVGTPTGGRWNAWVAGPCQWFIAHTKGKSKPCLEKMTKGVLSCPRCAQVAQPQMIGYLPLYRQVDAANVLVIVYELERPFVDVLETHQRVQIGREDEQSDSVWVRAALSPEPKWQTTQPERKVAADCTETLLRMWAIPELTQWYRECCQPSDNAMSLPTGVAVRPDGKPFSPMMQAAAKRHGADVVGVPDTAATFDAAYAKMAAKKAALDKPGENGHTKPKG